MCIEYGKNELLSLANHENNWKEQYIKLLTQN